MNDSFLSIVEDRDDPNYLLVRARKIGDIEKIFPDALVHTNLGGDYRYRAWVKRGSVVVALANEINSIDYDNFKNSISLGDEERYNAYTAVWSQMIGYQFGRFDENSKVSGFYSGNTGDYTEWWKNNLGKTYEVVPGTRIQDRISDEKPGTDHGKRLADPGRIFKKRQERKIGKNNTGNGSKNIVSKSNNKSKSTSKLT